VGLALLQLGRRREARAALAAAERLDPRDPATLYALAIFHAQNGERSQALEWADKLQAIAPDDPDVGRLVAGLKVGK
jgi:Flp pilus assembly protein TadD